jgi:DNA adenine methylase
MKPFIKYAGGKTQLLPEIRARLPNETFDLYVEPFVGGGAVLLDLQPTNAIINDINCELINIYQQLKENPRELIEILGQLPVSKVLFSFIASADLSRPYMTKNPVFRAARTLYLSKTCYNGLHRENSKGQFNVPWGDKKSNTELYNKNNLEEVIKYLSKSNISLMCDDFRNVDLVELANKKTFFYFDPPYYPLSETANFTDYNKNKFTAEDQKDLAQIVHEINKKGSKFMLSNSNTPFICSLYEDYHIDVVCATRNINSKGTGRTKKPIELIIRNYGREDERWLTRKELKPIIMG